MAVDELAERRTDGIVVRLLWDSVRDQVVLRYRDRQAAELFEIDVPNELALDAFEHPNLFRPQALAA
jgi:hypothetical protein